MDRKIKVIVADIDGTLIEGGNKPSRFTVETIETLMESGYLFGLASGRPVDDIKDKYKEWDCKDQFDFLIGWNGADLWDKKTDKKYRYNLLKKEWIKEIIEFMSEFDCAIHMYYGDKYLSSKLTEKAWYSAYKNKREFIIAKDISDFYQSDNAGIMFRADESIMPAIQEKLKQLKDKPYYGYNTQATLVEFSHRNCNKAIALEEYCKMYDIDILECLGFGDTTNDNEMLRVTKGVCLLNGSQDTKDAANYITEESCEDDGFAKFIRRYIL